MDSISQLQLQIKTLLEKFEKLNIIKSHLGGVNGKIEKSSRELDALEDVLDNELKDIQRLESIGVKSVFYKVLGNKEEQLEKERQEYLEASLKYKEHKQSLELLEYEKSVLEGKLGELPTISKQLEHLKELREKEILKSDSNIATHLRQILHEHDRCIMLNKEIVEALEEGEKSVKMLNIVLSYLRKARDWGRWDMQGSKRGSIMKHRAIDSAMKNLSKAQYQLDTFERELQDIGLKQLHLKIRSSQFDRFTDYFFDNLISDWIVQQKIKSTMTSVEASLDHVKRLCLSLKNEKETNASRILELDAAKDKLLLS